jgi:hypothetical protein
VDLAPYTPLVTTEDDDTAVTDARSRVAEVLARFEHIDPEGLSLVGLPAPDATRRAALRAQVIAVAERAGRLALLEEAETETRELVFRRFSESGFRPQPFGLNWLQSVGTAPDRVAIGMAVLDAAAAAVVEDGLADDVVVELTAPFEMLVGADLPGAGALLVGLGGRPVWVRLVLLGLAGAALLVAIFLAIDNASPLELLFGIPALAVIVAVLRARRPTAASGEPSVPSGLRGPRPADGPR